MTELKCPFCQQELKYDSWNEVYVCRNPNCKHLLGFGTKELWQALIDTKKKLDMCEGALEEYKDWFNKSQERLKIAVDALKWINETYKLGQELETDICAKCQYTLEQIKEQQ